MGRAGRQGDPGSAQTFVSAEDELLKRHLPATVQRRLPALARGTRLGSTRLLQVAFTQTQRNAQQLAYRQRLNVLRQDD
jgi:preprotein translocase subunit SecA